jgi:L-fuconolactonase
MAMVREEWLKHTVEDAIEPDLPVCDAHHHLWYQDGESYRLEQFLKDTAGGHNIVGTVFLESWRSFSQGRPPGTSPVAETEYIEDIVRRTPNANHVAAAIVGFADLTAGEAVMPLLEEHIAAGRGRFRGVRHICAWDASPVFKSADRGLLLDPEFRRGFACLKRYGLSFDAWQYHPQLMELVDLAKKFPDITIIANHTGGPLRIGPYAQKSDAVFRDWQRAVSTLAECPNVFIKLGGLGMEICGFGWHEKNAPPGSDALAEAMAPYFLYCIEKFDVARCMFESNFPVDKRSYSYNVVWNAFKKIARGFSARERNALFHDTAVKAYRLNSV